MARRPQRPTPTHPKGQGAGPAPTTPQAAGKGPGKGGGKPARVARAAPGAVWLYGRHPVEAALRNTDRRCRRLLATAEAAASLEEVLRDVDAPTPEPVDRTALDDLFGPNTVHQGVALEVDLLPPHGAEDIVRWGTGREHAVVMVLDQVTDPHNVGAVLRSASAFGALAVLVQDRHSPEETGALAKAASGALERVPLVRVANLARALELLKENGFWVAGLAADAPVTLARANLGGKVALCLGSEGEGLRRLTREHCDHLVRLPMAPDAVESLNVSNAAAVALYELTRDALAES